MKVEYLLQTKLHKHRVTLSFTFSGAIILCITKVMSSNSFRCRYTAEEVYDMLNKDSDASGLKEEAQKDIATMPNSVDKPPRSQ